MSAKAKKRKVADRRCPRCREWFDPILHESIEYSAYCIQNLASDDRLCFHCWNTAFADEKDQETSREILQDRVLIVMEELNRDTRFFVAPSRSAIPYTADQLRQVARSPSTHRELHKEMLACFSSFSEYDPNEVEFIGPFSSVVSFIKYN
jgi:phage terminase large subunit GpA-like protein